MVKMPSGSTINLTCNWATPWSTLVTSPIIILILPQCWECQQGGEITILLHGMGPRTWAHAMKQFGDIPYNSSDSSDASGWGLPSEMENKFLVLQGWTWRYVILPLSWMLFNQERGRIIASSFSWTSFPIFNCPVVVGTKHSSSSISSLDSQNRTRTHTVMCQLFLYITFCCQYEMKRRLMISLQYCAA